MRIAMVLAKRAGLGAWMAFACTGLASAGAAASSGYAYVAYSGNLGDGTLTAVDTATNRIGTPFYVTPTPAGIGITPDSRKMYVTSFADGTVTPVNLLSGAIGRPIPTGLLPVQVVVTPDNRTAYVGNLLGNTVTPIDVATDRALPAIPVASPGAITVTPQGKVYAANFLQHTVTPIDTATNTAGAPIPVGNLPGMINPSFDGRYVYACNFLDNTVTPIDTRTNQPLPPIATGRVPNGVAATHDGTRIYITDFADNDITVINYPAHTVTLPRIPVGLLPVPVRVTQDGTRAYVANVGGNNLSIVDTATNLPAGSIDVGLAPNALELPAAPVPFIPAPAVPRLDLTLPLPDQSALPDLALTIDLLPPEFVSPAAWQSLLGWIGLCGPTMATRLYALAQKSPLQAQSAAAACR